MRKVLLYECGDYVRNPKISTNLLSKVNYITTDNMLPNKKGIEEAANLPQNTNVIKFEKHDILISNIRPYFKKIWLAEFSGGCSSDVLVFRTNKNYNPIYIKYCLSQDSFFKYSMLGAKGSKMPRGDQKHILRFNILDYDLELQNKIANFLLLIDRKIKLNEKISKTLELLAKTIYDYWFVQFDFPDEKGRPYKSSGGRMVWNEILKKEIPVNWEVKTIQNVVESIKTGLNPRDNFILNNGNIRYITVKNIMTNGNIDFYSCDTVNEKARDIIHQRSDIKKGDILFASIAPLGRCYLIQENPEYWDINESVFSIRAKKYISPEYLYMFLTSNTFIQKAENSATGSIFAGIRIKTLEKIPVLVPITDVLNSFKIIISKIMYHKYLLEIENRNLSELRDFILPMLMNGQISVNP